MPKLLLVRDFLGISADLFATDNDENYSRLKDGTEKLLLLYIQSLMPTAKAGLAHVKKRVLTVINITNKLRKKLD